MSLTEQDYRTWVSSPGLTLATVLEKKGISKEAFSNSIGKSVDYVEDILSSKKPISEQLAQTIATLTSTSSRFWIKRENKYREGLEKITKIDENPNAKRWLESIPVKDIFNFKWLSPAPAKQSRLTDCLDYFEVGDIKEWHTKYQNVLSTVRFKKSNAYASKLGAMAAWLRQVQRIAEVQVCKKWNPTSFEQSLSRIRDLTRKKDPSIFLSKLSEICCESGVSFVVLRTPKGCPASGVSWFLSGEKAVIALSFRYLSDDHFWFTFFHEAAHLLLHGNTKIHVESDDTETDAEELEANMFSARTLIPEKFKEQLTKIPINTKSIISYATKVGVSPGIVVGQLQFNKRIEHYQFNGLKRRFCWTED